MYRPLAAILFLVGMIFSVEAEASSSWIPIQGKTPENFPRDGSAFLIGDRSEVPHFVWVDNGRLLVDRVAPDGTFVETNAAAGVTGTLSPLKVTPLSSGNQAVFFWSREGIKLTLWAVRDAGQGLSAEPVFSRSGEGGLPRYWPHTFGRKGWIVFFEGPAGIEAVRWNLDGTVVEQGVLLAASVVDIKVTERSDLDSGVLRAFFEADDHGTARFVSIDLTESQASPVTTWLSLSGPADSWAPSQTGNPESGDLFVATGSTLTWVRRQGGQLSAPATRSFPAAIVVSTTKVGNKEVLLLRPTNGDSRFWWRSMEWPLALDARFVPGVFAWDGAPLPLLLGDSGWTYLSDLGADESNWTFVRLDTEGGPAGSLPSLAVNRSRLFWTSSTQGTGLWFFHRINNDIQNAVHLLANGTIEQFSLLSGAAPEKPSTESIDQVWSERPGRVQEGGALMRQAWGIGGKELLLAGNVQ